MCFISLTLVGSCGPLCGTPASLAGDRVDGYLAVEYGTPKFRCGDGVGPVVET
jgi:hypothetical protein